MTSTRDRELDWPHPHYRKSLPRIMAFVLLLAVIQLLAWLLPPLPDSHGIPNYLPLHTLLETMSIVVSMMVFAVGWNAKGKNLSGNVVLLASVFFSIALLDFSHTISYIGMPEFITPNDGQKQLNFWLSARSLGAITLLIVALRPWQQVLTQQHRFLIFSSLIALTATINWTIIYHQNWFPDTYIPGRGLTPLKKYIEYVLIAINLLTAAVLLWRMRKPQSFNIILLFGAVCTMAMSEFFFTLYTNMTGSYNVLGHIYKALAYLFIYRAIVVETIEAPYQQLEEAQHQLSLSLQASSTGLWDWDLTTNEVYFSPEWKWQLGYNNEELPNKFETWESLIHPDDKANTLNLVTKFLASNSKQYHNEFRLRHRDGSYRWIMARGEKLFDKKGNAIRLMGSHIDITERKAAEQQILHLANYDAQQACLIANCLPIVLNKP